MNMESIKVEGTPKTPEIALDGNAGTLLISGRSIPENSVEFYAKVLSWLDAYSETPCPKTILDVKLEYFNTSSSKCLLDVFKRLEGLKKGGADVHIRWFYEEDDEDMLEAGEDYDSIIDLDFEMCVMEEQ
jgi:hypothetical protein